MAPLTRLRHHLTHRRLDPPLGFIHIPKAAGTALIQRIEANLRPLHRAYRLDQTQFGGFSTFASIAPALRAGIILTPHDIPANADLIAGHLSPTSIRTRHPTAHLVTLLRLPALRLLSHWFYWRGYTNEVLDLYGEWGSIIATARADLADFLSNPQLACVTDNIVLRMLLWPDPRIPADDFINQADDAALLAAALSTLADFAFTTIIEAPRAREQLDQFLATTYGVSPWTHLHRRLAGPDPIKANRSKIPVVKMRTPLATQLTTAAGPLLAQRTRLDDRLWQSIASRHLTQPAMDHLYHTALTASVRRYDALDNQL